MSYSSYKNGCKQSGFTVLLALAFLFGAAQECRAQGSTYAQGSQASPRTHSAPNQAPYIVAQDDIPYRRHFTPTQIRNATTRPNYSGGNVPFSHQGREAWEAAGRRARESEAEVYVRSAQQAEARGDWMQASFAYSQCSGGLEPTSDPTKKMYQQKWAYCTVQLLNRGYAGQNTGVDRKYSEHQLFRAYEILSQSDPGNAAWKYLKAVYWCSEHFTPEWNYIKAHNLCRDALEKCPNLTPAIRAKATALLQHITPAKELQVNDMKRAVFSMQQDVVWNVEHPFVAGTDSNEVRTTIDDTHERVTTWSRQFMNTELWAVETYPDCKRDLATKFPAWKPVWLKQLNQMMAMPNQGMAVPPGGNDEVAMCCPPRWEQLAFGPLDLTIGRGYPRSMMVKGSGHFDPDLLPRSYTSAMNNRLPGK